MPSGKDRRARQQVARANGRTVEMATQRALAELDFAPGELEEDQYEVTIVIPPEEGFMGVGAVDAVVEVALLGDEFDFYGPEDDSREIGDSMTSTSKMRTPRRPPAGTEGMRGRKTIWPRTNRSPSG